MNVGKKLYEGQSVADGMYDSLSNLKAPNMDQYTSFPHYTSAQDTYKHIIKLASNGNKISFLSLTKGEQLLRKIKPSVIDFYSITSLHFLNLSTEGNVQFGFLLNSVIDLIHSSSIEEMNTIWATILHKGHGNTARTQSLTGPGGRSFCQICLYMKILAKLQR